MIMTKSLVLSGPCLHRLYSCKYIFSSSVKNVHVLSYHLVHLCQHTLKYWYISVVNICKWSLNINIKSIGLHSFELQWGIFQVIQGHLLPLTHAVPSSTCGFPGWCHDKEMLSTLLTLCGRNPPVTGGFPSQRPVMWRFSVFFVVILNKLCNKLLSCWWFEKTWCSCVCTIMPNEINIPVVKYWLYLCYYPCSTSCPRN